MPQINFIITKKDDVSVGSREGLIVDVSQGTIKARKNSIANANVLVGQKNPTINEVSGTATSQKSIYVPEVAGTSGQYLMSQGPGKAPTWGTTNIKGDRGFQGFQGFTGPQGVRGYQGHQGPTGPTGARGYQGYQGYQGPVGPTGTTGVRGFQGFQGFQGPTGPKGSTGAASTVRGPQGYQGPTGPTGAASTVRGPQGYQGPTGPKGNTGGIGATGDRGPQGLQGPTGPKGSTGAASTVRGPQGLQGPTGPTGAASTVRGPQGLQGPTGPTGAASTVRGPQGYQGPSGTPYFSSGTGSSSSAGNIGTNYTVYAPAFYEASDVNLKNIISDLKEKISIEDIISIPKKYFTFKNDKNQEVKIGTIAQEVKKKFPELVDEDIESGFMGVQYNKLAIIALLGVELLYDKIKELESK